MEDADEQALEIMIQESLKNIGLTDQQIKQTLGGLQSPEQKKKMIAQIQYASTVKTVTGKDFAKQLKKALLETSLPGEDILNNLV